MNPHCENKSAAVWCLWWKLEIRQLVWRHLYIEKGPVIVLLDDNRCVTFDIAPNGRQAIIYTNDGIVYWHIYVPLCFDGLKGKAMDQMLTAKKHDLMLETEKVFFFLLKKNPEKVYVILK